MENNNFMESVQQPAVARKRRSNVWPLVLIIILLAGLLSLGVIYYLQNQQMQRILDANKTNSNITSFNKLFVEKVLKTKGEISYEDRLKLENAVAIVKDVEIQTAWKNFLESSTEAEAQDRTLVLLSLFPNKIAY